MKHYKKILILLSVSFLLTGCNKKEENPVSSFLKETISENAISENTIKNDIFVSKKNKEDPALQEVDYSLARNPFQLTKEEINNLELSELKAIMAVYTEDFRNTYGISEDKELKKEDWESIKFLLAYQIYGKEIFEQDRTVSMNELKELALENIQVDDESLLYLNPDPAYIQQLNPLEFKEWFEKASQYYLIDNKEFDANSIDLSSLSEDELKEMQNYFIAQLLETE